MIRRRALALLLVLCLLCPAALAAGRGFDGFRRTRSGGDRFDDVPADVWYYGSVVDAYELGLMSGAGSHVFSPDNPLSVAETLALACRLLSTYTGDAADFSGSPWYLPYVNYALEQGLIARDQFSNYEAPVTRAEAAAVFGALPVEMLAPVNDIQDNAVPGVAPGSPYYGAVYALYRAGILTGGDSQGSFLPDDQIRRSEAAAIAVRLADPSQRRSITLTAQPVTLYADNGSRIVVTPGEAMAYEALGWQRSAFTVPADAGAEAVLNAATLRPRATGTEALDTLVEGILSEIFTDDMDTYDKAAACYDYLIAHASPGGSTPRASGYGPYRSFSDYMLVLRTREVLERGAGSAEDYAAAFLVLTRRIGLSSYVFTGEAAQSGGSWAAHAWNVVSIGGTDFVFDAWAEDEAGGEVQHDRFCRTFDQVSGIYRNYDAESAKAEFNNFIRS